jgi:peroxiredoxin
MLTILIDGSTAAWASQYGLTFPVLDDDAETLWAIYGEGYIPLNIVLDRNMTIRYKTAGYTESEIVAAIKKYL